MRKILIYLMVLSMFAFPSELWAQQETTWDKYTADGLQAYEAGHSLEAEKICRRGLCNSNLGIKNYNSGELS